MQTLEYVPVTAIGWFFTAEEAKVLCEKLKNDGVPIDQDVFHECSGPCEECHGKSEDEIIERNLEQYFTPVNSRLSTVTPEVRDYDDAHERMVYFIGYMLEGGGMMPGYLDRLKDYEEQLKKTNGHLEKYLPKMEVRNLISLE